MHGLIHLGFKHFLCERFGFDAWEALLLELHIQQESEILQMKQYNDSTTFLALHTACAVVKQPLERILTLFGESFVEFALQGGFYNHIKSFGDDLPSLLMNINRMHQGLERDLRSAVFPTFKVETVTLSPLVVLLSSRSHRSGFEPFLCSVVKAVAHLLYDSQVDVEVLHSSESPPRSLTLSTSTEAAERVFRISNCGRMAPPRSRLPKSTGGIFSFCDFHSALMSMCRCPEPDVRSTEMSLLSEDWKTEEQPNSRADSADLLLRRLQDCNGSHSSSRSTMAPLLDHSIMDDDLDEGSDKMSLPSSSLVMASIGLGAARLKLSLRAAGLSAGMRLEAAARLFRSVPAGKVGASWEDLQSLSTASKIWSQRPDSNGDSRLSTCYGWSEIASTTVSPALVRFLSHSWEEPDNWQAVMGHSCSYAEVKCTEVCSIAKDLAALENGDHRSWQSVRLFVDKCCIPQHDPELLRWCVSFIDQFIQLSSGLIVILSWTYFERLWCVYEWACFLIYHEPGRMALCLDAFLVPKTQELYLRSLRDFSLDRCKCEREEDRAILYRKVANCYTSTTAFESFLKYTAIAQIARHLAQRRASFGSDDILPWARLALEAGFGELSDRLFQLAEHLPKWHEELATSSLTPAADLQTAITKKVEAWFATVVDPMIMAVRQTSIRPFGEQPAD